MVSFTQSAWGIDLLESEAGWTFSQGRTYGLPSYDENNKSISTVNNWGQNYATYELGAFLEASEGEAGKLSFSFTLTTSNTVDSMAGIAFVGSQQALVMGSPEYKKNDVGYSLSSNVHADIYTAENWGSATTTANIAVSDYTMFQTGEPAENVQYTLGTPYTISGDVTLNNGQYTLTILYNGTQVVKTELDKEIDISRVVFFADGGTTTLSALTLTGTPATITELVWGGTESNNTWSASSTPWVGTATSSAKSNVTFGTLSEAISDTVIISGDVTARSVVVNDNYTFQADGTAGISTDRGITIASGKILNISAGTLEVTGTMAGEVSIADNAALSLLEQTSITGLKVTGGTGAALNLDIPLDATGDGRVILSEGSKLDRINVTGMMAYNMNGGAVTSDLGGADLHLANNGVLLIRNGVSGNLNETANIGDIYFDGEVGEIRVYGSVSENNNAVIDNNITAAGKLQKTDGGYITLSGVVNATEIISSNTHWGGGTLGLNGLTETDTLMAKGGHINIGTKGSVSTDRLIANGGNITISGEVTTGQVRLKDESGTGTITVNTGGVLNVTGSTNEHSNNDSLMMAHYGTYQGEHLSSGLIIDGGELNAGDAVVFTSWSSAGYFKVKRGTATVKGINFWGQSYVYGLVELGSADGDGTARLNIGDTGIKDFGTNEETVGIVFNLGNGILGATADWATASNPGFPAGKFKLIGTGTGTVVDTTDAVDKTTARHITFNNALTGSGKLVVDGKGSLTLKVAGDNTGDVTINSEATLKLQSGGEYTMTHNVAGAGTLQVESGTTLLSNSKTIASKLVLNGGNATLGGNRTIEGDIVINSGSILTASADDSLQYDAKDTLPASSRSITIKEGGELAMGNHRWSIGRGESGEGGGTEAIYVINLAGGKITRTGNDIGNLDYSDSGSIVVTGTKGEISADIRIRNNSKVTFESTEDNDTAVVSGVIKDAGSINKTGKGSLRVSGANTYTGGTTVTKGILETANAAALGTGKVSLEGGILKLAAALSVSAMDYVSGSSQVQLQANNLEVTGTLSVGENVGMQITGSGAITVNTLQLNAGASISTEGALSMTNLSMGKGSSMAANETINLNGTLTLGSGIKLTGSLLTKDALDALGTGEKLEIFSGITQLNFMQTDGATRSSSATVAYTETVDFNNVFSVEGVDDGMYELTFSNGSLWASQMNIPEPATTTLSLLALAGLAMRRRRR